MRRPCDRRVGPVDRGLKNSLAILNHPHMLAYSRRGYDRRSVQGGASKNTQRRFRGSWTPAVEVCHPRECSNWSPRRGAENYWCLWTWRRQRDGSAPCWIVGHVVLQRKDQKGCCIAKRLAAQEQACPVDYSLLQGYSKVSAGANMQRNCLRPVHRSGLKYNVCILFAARCSSEGRGESWVVAAARRWCSCLFAEWGAQVMRSWPDQRLSMGKEEKELYLKEGLSS